MRNELDKIFSTPVPEFDAETLNKEIILYGAGELGQMAGNLLNQVQIRPKYIVDKSAKGEIDGIKIISPEEIFEEDKKNSLFLICIATISYNEIEGFVKSFGCQNTMQFYTYAYLKMPELLSNGWFLKDAPRNEIEKICETLSHDEQSLAHYLQFLWWKLRIKEAIYEDFPVLSGKKLIKSTCLPSLKNDEVLIDGGAHFGQTIEAFIEKTNGEFKHIYAFEPDEINFKSLKEKATTFPIKFREKISIFQEALSDKVETVKYASGLGYASKTDKNGNKNVKTVNIDSFKDLKPTIIKLHVEGDELKALIGARKTISKYRPILMVLADHTKDGLHKIAEELLQYDNYKLYFNLHDYCGNTAIFYAVPKERTI